MRTGRARDRAEYREPSSFDTVSTVLPVHIEIIPSNLYPQFENPRHSI